LQVDPVGQVLVVARPVHPPDLIQLAVLFWRTSPHQNRQKTSRFSDVDSARIGDLTYDLHTHLGWDFGHSLDHRYNHRIAGTKLGGCAVGELDPARLNVNGGAIALGHPVGATGTRLVVTLLREMRRRGAARGLATLCVGGGQGAAVILEAA